MSLLTAELWTLGRTLARLFLGLILVLAILSASVLQDREGAYEIWLWLRRVWA